MITRFIKNQLIEQLKPGKVVGLFGARRTGKTWLMNDIRQELVNENILMVQGDNLEVAQILSGKRLSELTNFVKDYSCLFIDEAQKVPEIGINLKLLTDNVKGLKIFITGSSALELRNKTGEPLTGRSINFHLFPFCQSELIEDYLKTSQSLENKMIFGLYPDVYMSENDKDKKEMLVGIRDSYLLKDVLELENKKDSLFMLKLLRLIAFQIGQDVSFNELAGNLNISRATVQKYLHLLENAYVIFSLHGFSRNLRKEYSKSPRYYFWDNGILNSVISNFNILEFRDDTGRLWENYCMSERYKLHHYLRTFRNLYFWRTYDQQEIDLIEEGDGKIFAYEFKWKSRKGKIPKLFTDTYAISYSTIITKENYLEFITNL